MGTPELPVPDGLVLRPFRGVRYAVDDPAGVTSPPYDLISDSDVDDLLASHPNNVVRLILPCARSPRPSTAPSVPASVVDAVVSPDPAASERYGAARDTLREWLSSGVLAADSEPALYVYEQQGAGVLQRGLIGDVGLTDPESRVILPHEDVMPGPVADRLALMSTTQANLEPIFLLYDGSRGPASTLVDTVATTRAPLIDASTSDGVRHRLWAITDPAEISAINGDLHHRQALIADGHHRYATYRVLQRQEHAGQGRNGPWDFGLALLVDSSTYPPDLKPIHRVIPGLPLAEATSRAENAWRVSSFDSLQAGLEALAQAADPAFLLAGETGTHLLTDPDQAQLERAMPADHSPQWRALNTSILTRFILPHVWGLEDDERTVRIVHHDAHAAVRQATRTGGTAVILKSLHVDSVLAVAARGERVPRKSTSFGPKPRTGLLLRTFAID
ncbi:DUF1015 family protein [Nonomuraea sp. NPDC050536]|uniref:DUF1015 family protein n=1 Tax=Nonomuraea sp. NPDC050536 TaxID=3364366 RepID=UPI0037C9562B